MRPAYLLVLFLLSRTCAAVEASDLASLFQSAVERHYDVPAEADSQYQVLAQQQLSGRGIVLGRLQLVVVVDRNPRVQALFVYVGGAAGAWTLVGAGPVSTGVRSRFDHYITPTGVWDHDQSDFGDYRAQGTVNDHGVRGYGARGMRVWDIGWTNATKGWGKGEAGRIRLQMHATDPDLLEGRLGSPASKGCVRISSQMNTYLDRIGALDWHLEQATTAGKKPWVLRPDRVASDLAGRYLVIVDSDAKARPAWAAPPTPARRKRRHATVTAAQQLQHAP